MGGEYVRRATNMCTDLHLYEMGTDGDNINDYKNTKWFVWIGGIVRYSIIRDVASAWNNILFE